MIKGLVYLTMIMIGICADASPVPAQLSSAKPDLRVEELSLVSVTRDPGKKMVCIQVLIRVKNIGKGFSGEYQIAGYYNSPAGSQKENRVKDVIIVPATAAGASFVKVYRFMEPEKEFRNGLFEFRIKSDDRNKVSESDELNNYSVSLRLETPAEK